MEKRILVVRAAHEILIILCSGALLLIFLRRSVIIDKLQFCRR